MYHIAPSLTRAFFRNDTMAEETKKKEVSKKRILLRSYTPYCDLGVRLRASDAEIDEAYGSMMLRIDIDADDIDSQGHEDTTFVRIKVSKHCNKSRQH